MMNSLLRRSLMAALLLSGPAAASEPAGVPSYLLGVGDALTVTVFGRTDFVSPFPIGPDGAIRLPLVGSVAAAGRTRQELEDDVRDKLGKVLHYDAQVTVDVATYQPVYVFGDVGNPGEQIFIAGLTALKAYARAGGTPTLFQTQQNTNTAETAAVAERDLRIAQADLFTALIHRAALDAAIAGQRDFALPPELEQVKNAPLIVEIMAREKATLNSDMDAQAAADRLIKAQKDELNVEIAALQAEGKANLEQSKFIAAELESITNLQKRGLTTNQRLIEMQQLKSGLEAETQRLNSYISTARQQQGSLDINRQQVRADWLRDRQVDRVTAAADIERNRARIEGARMQLAALGQVSIADLTAGRTELSFTLTRTDKDGTRVMPATGATPMHPGDVLEVHMRSLDQPGAAPAAARPPARTESSLEAPRPTPAALR
jgi:protein involved in polysaccharide export with SLBB domain